MIEAKLLNDYKLLQKRKSLILKTTKLTYKHYTYYTTYWLLNLCLTRMMKTLIHIKVWAHMNEVILIRCNLLTTIDIKLLSFNILCELLDVINNRIRVILFWVNLKRVIIIKTLLSSSWHCKTINVVFMNYNHYMHICQSYTWSLKRKTQEYEIFFIILRLLSFMWLMLCITKLKDSHNLLKTICYCYTSWSFLKSNGSYYQWCLTSRVRIKIMRLCSLR